MATSCQRAWLWPHSVVAVAGFLLVAAGWLSGFFNVVVQGRQIVGLLGVAAISILAAERLLPRESLWQAFPVALLALVPAGRLAARLETLVSGDGTPPGRLDWLRFVEQPQ